MTIPEQQADELAKKAAFIIANRITVNGKNIMLQKDWETANLICKQLILQELNLVQLLDRVSILEQANKASNKAIEDIANECGKYASQNAQLLRDKECLNGYRAAFRVIEGLHNDAVAKLEPRARRENWSLEWWKGYHQALVAVISLSAYGEFPEVNKAAMKQTEEKGSE